MNLSQLHEHIRFEYIDIWDKDSESMMTVHHTESTWYEWLGATPLDDWKVFIDANGSLGLYMSNWCWKSSVDILY